MKTHKRPPNTKDAYSDKRAPAVERARISSQKSSRRALANGIGCKKSPCKTQDAHSGKRARAVARARFCRKNDAETLNFEDPAKKNP